MMQCLSVRQQEIVKASLELIAQKGIQGLTIKNIAQKLGVVESAIYRHYRSKISILSAILDIVKRQALPECPQKDASEITRLEQKFKNHLRAFASFPALVSVVFSEDIFQNEKLLSTKTKEMVQLSMAETISIIKKGQRKKEIRTDVDAEQLAIMATGAIRFFVKQWKMNNYSFNLVRNGDALINSIKLLLKPDES
jgi:AcrR family transcriptional regulator